MIIQIEFLHFNIKHDEATNLNTIRKLLTCNGRHFSMSSCNIDDILKQLIALSIELTSKESVSTESDMYSSSAQADPPK